MKKAFLHIVLFLVFISPSCQQKEKKSSIILSAESLIDTSATSCPYLTKDSKGNIVLSFIRKAGTTTSIFCYTVSKDYGKTFGKTIEIPGSTNVHPHGENMPKLIFKPSGEIIAVWGALNTNPKNAYAGLIYYAQSFDEGKTWSKALALVKDTASYDQRYFDIAMLPNGEAAIVWLDNRKNNDKEGSGLYYAFTTGATGFANERLISEPCCPCCRTNLFIDSKQNIHVLYRAILNDSIRDMVHIISTDKGNSFTAPGRISSDNWVINGCPHTGPSMAENKEGIHFTWFTGGSGNGVFYNHSTDNGKTFSSRNSVSGKASKHAQITTLPRGDILIVWNESFPKGKSFSSRVGLEKREAGGSKSFKQYITSEEGNASFPVIKPIDEHSAIVAYTVSINETDKVAYKVVMLKE